MAGALWVAHSAPVVGLGLPCDAPFGVEEGERGAEVVVHEDVDLRRLGLGGDPCGQAQAVVGDELCGLGAGAALGVGGEGVGQGLGEAQDGDEAVGLMDDGAAGVAVVFADEALAVPAVAGDGGECVGGGDGLGDAPREGVVGVGGDGEGAVGGAPFEAHEAVCAVVGEGEGGAVGAVLGEEVAGAIEGVGVAVEGLEAVVEAGGGVSGRVGLDVEAVACRVVGVVAFEVAVAACEQAPGGVVGVGDGAVGRVVKRADEAERIVVVAAHARTAQGGA